METQQQQFRFLEARAIKEYDGDVVALATEIFNVNIIFFTNLRIEEYKGTAKHYSSLDVYRQIEPDTWKTFGYELPRSSAISCRDIVLFCHQHRDLLSAENVAFFDYIEELNNQHYLVMVSLGDTLKLDIRVQVLHRLMQLNLPENGNLSVHHA